jgi:cytochrome c oxidase subunit 2
MERSRREDLQDRLGQAAMNFLSRLGRSAAAFVFAPAVLAGALAFAGGSASAQPQNYEFGFQEAVTPVMQRIAWFHDILFYIITAITIFVLVLLLWVMYRYSEKRNPNPSKTTHNVVLELAWTLIPVANLLGIAVPSFKQLYFSDRVEDADITIKAVGRQWYWSFEYPDHGNFTFDSFIVAEGDLQPGQPRLLTADNALVLPVDTNIRILVTASDVLHNFAMPQFGLKTDAVPGRINETWTYVPAEYAGQTFYGQCSELCGTGHAYMPINIHMVTKAEFAAWTEQAREQYGSNEAPREVPGEQSADVKIADAGVQQSK